MEPSLRLNSIYVSLAMRFTGYHRLDAFSDLKEPPLHGHNYKLWLTFATVAAPEDEISLKRGEIIEKAYKALYTYAPSPNLDEWFPKSSGEVIAQHLFLGIKPALLPHNLVEIRIEETNKNHFVARC